MLWTKNGLEYTWMIHSTRWFVRLLVTGMLVLTGACATGTLPEPRASTTPTAIPARLVRQTLDAQRAWREDLMFLAESLRTRHPSPFYRTSESDFQQLVNALDQEIPFLSREQMIVALIRISALIDGHTQISIAQPSLNFHLYALRLYAFSDGIYVIDAQAPYRSVIGARLVSIGGRSAASIYTQIAPLIHHDNDMTIRLIAPTYHLIPEVLMALGIIVDPQQPAFVFAKPDGEQITLNPAALSIGAYQQWSGFFLTGMLQRPEPLYLSRRDEPFWFTFLADAQTLYIQYNQVRSASNGESMSAFALRLEQFVSAHGVKRVVVDVRHNSGGDNTTYGPLLSLLRDNGTINQRGKLFLITGRQTFSAAANFATEIERSTQAIFAGEPMGGRPNLYGDVRPYTLPNSKLIVQISSRYWQISSPDDTRPSIEPQIAASLSAADYFSGRDPALDAILDYHPSR